MPHLGRVNGASLVPDFSSGVSAIAQGLQFQRKERKADTKRTKVSGLIEQLGQPGISSNQEQKTLLRLSQLTTQQEFQGLMTVHPKRFYLRSLAIL